MPAAATVAGPYVGNQSTSASYIAPAGQSPLQVDVNVPAQALNAPAATSGAAWGPPPVAETQADPFTSMERKFREYGATYYLLGDVG